MSIVKWIQPPYDHTVADMGDGKVTRNELSSELYYIVGDWKKVAEIFILFGKLSPEPTGKPQAPTYDSAKVRRVGKEKIKFTSKQKLETRALLRKMGLI